MPLKLPVPLISITSDVEDDDDRTYMSLQDALTDLEDLDDDEPITSVHNNNIKFKVDFDKSDSYITDVEDVECSDIEDENNIVKHSKPIQSKIFDISPGILEETYKIKSKNSRERKKLRSQVTVMRSSQTLNKPSTNDESGLTDLEDVFASDEDILSNDNIPDTYFPLTMLEDIEGTNINDSINFKANSVLLDTFLNGSDDTTYLRPSFSIKNNLTDVEVVSEGENTAIKKNKRVRRRRPKGTLRNQGAVTDIEDVDMSNEDAKMYKSLSGIPIVLGTTNQIRKPNLFYSSQSFLYDSDNEEDDPIILRKDKKKNLNLVLPEVDDGLTDVDDVNMSDSDNEYKYNCSAMEVELKKLSDAYGDVHDVASKLNEDSSSSDNEPQLKNKNKVNDSKYNISFKKLEMQNVKYLVLPNQIQSVLTDVESICSSDDEKDKKLPVAIVEQVVTGSKTDEEMFSDDDEIEYFTDEKSLPKVFRKIILIKENKSGEPIVKVLPLSDFSNPFAAKDELNYLTDVENMSDDDNEDEFSNNNSIPISESDSEVIFMEKTQINESERSRGYYDDSKEVHYNISGCKTDIEEIYVDHKKRNKKYTKKSTKLEVKTDYEDLSDCSEKHLSVQKQTADLTDTENLDLSENDIDDYKIPATSQNDYLNMEGELTITKEGNDASSKNTTLLNVNVIKCTNKIITPMVTDTEEIAASADDENYEYICNDSGDGFDKLLNESSCTNISSKYTKKINLDAPEERIYLKGSLDTHTDIEDLESAESLNEAIDDIKTDKNISIDWKNNFVVFGSCNEEWEASREDTEEDAVLPLRIKTQENIGETSTSGPRSLTGKKSGPQVEADESNVGTTSRSVITEDKESKQARKLKEEKDKE